MAKRSRSLFGFWRSQKGRKEGVPVDPQVLPVSIESTQRRHLFRISPPSEEPIKFSIELDSGLRLSGKVLDISGGGFSFLTYQEYLQTGRLIQVQLELPGGEMIRAGAVIRNLRPWPLRDLNLPEYKCGVEFRGTSEAILHKIFQYVHKKQLEELRRKWN